MKRTISSVLAAAGLAIAAAAPGSAAGTAPSGVAAVDPAPAAVAPAAPIINRPYSRGGDYVELVGKSTGRLTGAQGNVHQVTVYMQGWATQVRIRSQFCPGREVCQNRPALEGTATVHLTVSRTTRSAHITGTLRASTSGGRVLVPFDIPVYATGAPHPLMEDAGVRSWVRRARIAPGASIGRLALHNTFPWPEASAAYGRYRYVTAP